MFQKNFIATDDAGWSGSVELTDANTNEALDDATDALFELSIKDDCGSVVLSATTADDTLTKPSDNVVQWSFTETQMGTLCPGNTYSVGLRMTTNTGTVPLLVGSLAIIDGGF